MSIFVKNLEKIWRKVEVRLMIMVSLVLQILLITFGSRRKSTNARWIVSLVWLCYLLADNIATVSLGFLLRDSVDNSPNDSSRNTATMPLSVFWTPFVLLHLGGPDTITAYSKKDNDLWLRHLLSLIIQVGTVFYGLLKYWKAKDALSILAIPIFISGLMKYGERTWVLWSTSTDAYYLERLTPIVISTDSLSDANIQQIAASFVNGFRDLINGDPQVDSNFRDLMVKMPVDKAFELVELELSLMFDVLYTKVRTIYSVPGVCLRFIAFLSATSTLAIFCIVINKDAYSHGDIMVTIFLLVGATASEIYAVLTNVFSDWTLMWLANKKKPLCVSRIFQAISSSRLYSLCNKGWSRSMGQFDPESYANSGILLQFLVRGRPFGLFYTLGIGWLVTRAGVNKLLRERIFEQLKWSVEFHLHHEERFSESVFHGKRKAGNILTQILSDILVQFHGLRKRAKEEAKNSTAEQDPGGSESLPDLFLTGILSDFEEGELKDFDNMLLNLHAATHNMYSDSKLKPAGSLEACEVSKQLADYMFYLLAVCPLMLPRSLNRMKQAKTAQIYKQWHEGKGSHKICEDLKLHLEAGELTQEQIWEMMCQVWSSILIYAASKCTWEEHVGQLCKGGELLTHVWLLMVHLGLAEEFEIRQEVKKESFVRTVIINGDPSVD